MVARSCFFLRCTCTRIIRIVPSFEDWRRIICIIFIQHAAIVSICTCGLSAISVVISVERIQSIRYTFVLNRLSTLWRIDSSKWCAVRRTRRANPRGGQIALYMVIIGITLGLIVIPTHITRVARLCQTEFYLLVRQIVYGTLRGVCQLLLPLSPCSCVTCTCLCLELYATNFHTLSYRNTELTRMFSIVIPTHQGSSTLAIAPISWGAYSNRFAIFQHFTTQSCPTIFKCKCPIRITQGYYFCFSFCFANNLLTIHIINHRTMLMLHIYHKVFCLRHFAESISHWVYRHRNRIQLLFVIGFTNHAHLLAEALVAVFILHHHIIRIVYPSQDTQLVALTIQFGIDNTLQIHRTLTYWRQRELPLLMSVSRGNLLHLTQRHHHTRCIWACILEVRIIKREICRIEPRLFALIRTR